MAKLYCINKYCNFTTQEKNQIWCSECGCKLVSSCPSCNKEIINFKDGEFCSNCGFQIKVEVILEH